MAARVSRRDSSAAATGSGRRRDRGGRDLESGAKAARIRGVTPKKVDLVTEVLDIENVGDQIAV